MPLVITQAIVLHAFNYLESSRVLRLITREAGVQSVIAKGMRRSRGRIGSGIDLFAEGEAQIYIKPTRDLHTMGAFDVVKSRAGLALEMGRFTAGSAIAELVLRVAGDDQNAAIFDTVSTTLDAIAIATGDEVAERALAGAWQLIAGAGFSPALDDCAMCHAALAPGAAVAFSHPAGGVLCDDCARRAVVARQLPVEARGILRMWGQGAGNDHVRLTARDVRAHQRLLREFVREHVATDDRPMRAFAAWESNFGEPAATPG